MERREFIENAALLTIGLATAAQASTLNASEASNPKVSPLLLRAGDATKLLPRFTEAASMCAMSGDICVQHCEEQLAKGATEFSHCSLASGQMAALCGAAGRLAAMKSVRLAEILDSCSAACKACKEACEEHKAHWKKGMHLECKACAEHCEELIAEVAKMKAALGKA